MDEFDAEDSEAGHVMMWNTLRPPSALGCKVWIARRRRSRRLKNRSCVSVCESGAGITRVSYSVCSDNNSLFDTKGCSADTHGNDCRTCYTNMAAAKEAGALGHDAIMCSTLEDANSEIKTEVAAVAMTVQNDHSRRLTLTSGRGFGGAADPRVRWRSLARGP